MSEFSIRASECGYAHVWAHEGPRGSEPPVAMRCACGKLTWADALREKADAAAKQVPHAD